MDKADIGEINSVSQQDISLLTSIPPGDPTEQLATKSNEHLLTSYKKTTDLGNYYSTQLQM